MKANIFNSLHHKYPIYLTIQNEHVGSQEPFLSIYGTIVSLS